ncbi:MAG: Zn-dependent hydrolase, partial [Rhizobiales bacterium]|nr:Zn-dependent hydrolase [Hyphomicrobiales bacterium]
LDPVYVGSHLDTQPTGGRYDGVLGVLSALELVRTLNDLGIRTRRPIVIVNWTNEEGARFAPAMMASGVFAGQFSLDYAYGRKDPDGKTFGDELKRIGWVGDEKVGARRMHAYFEYHIEQGPILEAERKQVGVVTHGQGLWWLEFTLTGKEAHTGSTPMNMRVNAGLAMARIFEMVQRIAMDNQPGAVGGVGQVFFSPNSRNVLPGKVVFTVDIRSPDQAKLDAMRARIEAEAPEICEALGVKCAIEPVGHFDPVTFDPTLVARVRKAAEDLGYSHMNIISGAGHDACWAAKVAPATMIMCPCVDGLSHNEAENISKEWAEGGADVLLRAVLETAEIVP